MGPYYAEAACMKTTFNFLTYDFTHGKIPLAYKSSLSIEVLSLFQSSISIEALRRTFLLKYFCRTSSKNDLYWCVRGQ